MLGNCFMLLSKEKCSVMLRLLQCPEKVFTFCHTATQNFKIFCLNFKYGIDKNRKSVACLCINHSGSLMTGRPGK